MQVDEVVVPGMRCPESPTCFHEERTFDDLEITKDSVLQPPRNKRFKLFHKGQIRKATKM